MDFPGGGSPTSPDECNWCALVVVVRVRAYGFVRSMMGSFGPGAMNTATFFVGLIAFVTITLLRATMIATRARIMTGPCPASVTTCMGLRLICIQDPGQRMLNRRTVFKL